MSDPIYVLMGKVLEELPAIGKNRRNEQQNFMFRGIDDALNALNPVLANHGVFFVPEVVERIDDNRVTAKGGTMYVVHLHVRYRFFGPAGDFVEATAWGEGTDSGDKATSKAMTAAMKSVLFQSFAISVEEQYDPDASTPEPSSPQRRPVQQQAPAQQSAPPQGTPATEPQKKAIYAIANRKGIPMPDRDSMTKAEAGAWIEANGDSPEGNAA